MPDLLYYGLLMCYNQINMKTFSNHLHYLLEATMSYTVTVNPGARRQIKKLPKTVQAKINHALTDLETNPRPHGAKNYKVLRKFALRIGNYRVIYEIKDPSLMIFVIRVGDRKEIYREYG